MFSKGLTQEACYWDPCSFAKETVGIFEATVTLIIVVKCITIGKVTIAEYQAITVGLRDVLFVARCFDGV